MASSNNSVAENNKKKTKKPQTSTPTSKIKKDNKNIEKSKENNKNNNKNQKKLNFTNGDSKEQKENGRRKKHENDDDEEEGAKTHVFPMNRIRTILKGEISDLRVSQEALLAINNAAEKFLEQLAEEAYGCCAQDRKKSLSYNHLSRVVSKQRKYDFLSDFVPEKVKAEDALRETNSRGNTGG